jgi:uncharacterized protein (DUF302 family)
MLAASRSMSRGAFAMKSLRWSMGLAAALLCTAGAVAQPMVSYTRSGAKVADVRDDLKTAIESRGFVVDYQAQINTMLERTGKDVGSAKPLYVDAQSLQFCSAQLSRRMMEADPANVVMCPYTLVVYATVARPQQVVVAYRRPLRQGGSAASHAALREVDKLLDGLAREAVGKK